MGSIYDLSTVAASNTTIDSTDVSGTTGKIKDGDNVMRSLGAFDAQFVDDLGAVNTVAGTADVITVALASAITAYATGQIFRFIAGGTNTTNVTMNVNSIGAKAVRKISGGTDVALVAGDLVAGETYTLIYRASANSAAGGWVIQGKAELAPYLTTTTAAATYLPLAGGTMTGILNLGTVGQVKFPGTQNASSDANTLDDYEEGAWTPGITVNSSATGITYSAQTGNYLKIGQFVFLSGHVALTNNGASVGGVRITGLPFTSAATHPGGGSVNYFGNMSGIVGNPLLYVDPAATTAILYNSNAATVVQLTDTQVTNTADFFFTISYRASA